jgi:hypothetical protein
VFVPSVDVVCATKYSSGYHAVIMTQCLTLSLIVLEAYDLMCHSRAEYSLELV